MDPQTAQLFNHPFLSSPHAETRLRDILNLPNEVIRDDFFPFGTKLAEDLNTVYMWAIYLETHGYDSAFLPLVGTERSRYNPIIANAVAQELYEQRIAMHTLCSFHQSQLQTRQQINDRNLALLHRWGAERPVALEDLQEFCHRPLRHTRQISQFPINTYPTAYGFISACTKLPKGDWYLGHRPGDPVIRIDGDPLKGKEQQYWVHWEGVVPFNKAELKQRFIEYVFPNLAKMALAAVSFDPLNRGTHPWVVKMLEAINLEFSHPEAQSKKTLTVRLLHRLWDMRYGDRKEEWPFFLQIQYDCSVTAFREMGFLLNQLKVTNDGIWTTHFWSNCKNLVQRMSGSDIETLATDHHDGTLMLEAFDMVAAGQLDNMVIYTRLNGAKKIQERYDSEGIECIPFERILALRRQFHVPTPLRTQLLLTPSPAVARQPVANTQLPPPAPAPQPIPEEQNQQQPVPSQSAPYAPFLDPDGQITAWLNGLNFFFNQSTYPTTPERRDV
ncbi:hypothetical protein FHL15_000439 [Xylaria flabelliformis]|uniref:Uncharacterized protein n=1 Tax=Xylaria flabelliformis TaxID=2512241 RepID=A0A553IFW5_9PEZI|nr:hypothetical protein FHL15_000439 [Xylaria flabelliformis]